MGNSSHIQRIVTFKNSQDISARGTILRLSRSSVVFEVYNPYSIVQLSEVLQQFTIRRGQRAIYTGRAVVTNLVNTGLMLIVSVNLPDAWSDLAGLIETGRGIGDEVKRFIEDFDSLSNVRAGYQLVVATLRNFLSELVRWLDQVDIDSRLSGFCGLNLTEEVFSEISGPLFLRLAHLFQSFEEEAVAVPSDAISYHKAYAQRDLHPLLLQAPFINRTVTKPLGYAGDFEIVNMMVRNQREGPNTYSQLIHKFYVSSRTCQAHRNRIQIVSRRLAEIAKDSVPGEKVRILNIGCGPAHEILDLIQREALSHLLVIELLDFNKETLEATCQSVDAFTRGCRDNPEFKYVHESVHNLLKNAARPEARKKEAVYDFIYCAGLFDYLSDRVCSRLLSLFERWVKTGGLILATNVHPSSEYRGVMEHILDWYLIYRDEIQMGQLVSAEFEKRVYTDDTGMNVFLEVRTAAHET